MRHSYATLFDRNYLAQGVVMLKSLLAHADEPTIYVLAMDKETETALRTLDLPGVMIVAHRDFEVLNNTVHLQLTRTWREYCWTCASLLTLHCAPLANWSITYLDADLYFFSNPAVIHTEIGDRSIGIIPHRFNVEYQRRYGANGKYNVGWVTFKGAVGRQCLQSWAIQCREWCYYRNENGKFADQGYLDSWVEKYGEVNVCEITNPGAGLAPWNSMNHSVCNTDNGVAIDGHLLVFYHFHQGTKPKHQIGHVTRGYIYKPYTQALLHEQQQLDNLSLARP